MSRYRIPLVILFVFVSASVARDSTGAENTGIVDALNDAVKDAGAAPKNGSCSGCLPQSAAVKPPAFCSDPLGTVCPPGNTQALQKKIDGFKKRCIADILKKRPPLPPEPIPANTNPDLLPPKNIEAIEAWKKEYREYVRQLQEASFADHISLKWLFEQMRAHEIEGMWAQQGIDPNSKARLRESLMGAQLLTPVEFLDLLAVDTQGMDRYNAFRKWCGHDGMSVNAWNTGQYNYIVFCPGSFVRALKNVDTCGKAKDSAPETSSKKPTGEPAEKSLWLKAEYQKMSADKTLTVTKGPKFFAVPFDSGPPEGPFELDALAETLGHELGHSIDAKSSSWTKLSPGYKSFKACVEKKFPKLTPIDDYMGEIMADYWAAEGAAKRFRSEYGIARYFNQLTPDMVDEAARKFFGQHCEQPVDPAHPQGNQRISRIFGIDPSFRDALGCPPGLLEGKKTCTFAGEVPVK